MTGDKERTTFNTRAGGGPDMAADNNAARAPDDAPALDKNDPISAVMRAGRVLSAAEITGWLRALRGRPYVPGSHYDVGAVLRVDNIAGGPYYFAGVNVENVENLLSVHGEGAALSAMLAALGPEARVAEIYVMAAPRGLTAGSADPRTRHGGSCCGRCRQHLWENAAAPDMKVHTIALDGSVKTDAIAALLPDGFSFADFSAHELPPQMKDHSPAAAQARLWCAQTPAQADILLWLRDLRSRCLATGIEQVAVLALDNGAAVAGVRMEDAAFTGLNAVQAAAAIACGMFGDIRIVHAYVMHYAADWPDTALQPVPLSALQLLREFGTSRLPLTVFSAGGAPWHSTVAAAAAYAPTYGRVFMHLRDGQVYS